MRFIKSLKINILPNIYFMLRVGIMSDIIITAISHRQAVVRKNESLLAHLVFQKLARSENNFCIT